MSGKASNARLAAIRAGVERQKRRTELEAQAEASAVADEEYRLAHTLHYKPVFACEECIFQAFRRMVP